MSFVFAATILLAGVCFGFGFFCGYLVARRTLPAATREKK
jgi:uncharacterized protein YneF (UPF0154 family)